MSVHDKGTNHGTATGRDRTGLRGRHHRGPDQVPRLDRRLVGGAVLAPQGLHAGLHDRARLHGQAPARVRAPQREGHRPVGRRHRRPRGVGQRHRGDPGRPAQLPDHRRRRLQRVEALRDAAGQHVGRRQDAHAGRQPDRAQRVRDRARQEGQADPRLPDDDGPQLRRGAAGHRLAPAHRQAPGGDAGQLEAGRGRDHRRLGVQRRGQGDLRRLEGAEALHPHRAPAEHDARLAS